jgi:hypothetical protein
MILRQQQAEIPGVLHQATARLRQPLLQAGERPCADSVRQHQPPPQVARVVGDHAHPALRDAPRSTESGGIPQGGTRDLHRLLAIFDRRRGDLGRSALVVESRHRAAVNFQVGHDESDRGNNSPKCNSAFATTLWAKPFALSPATTASSPRSPKCCRNLPTGAG